MKPARHTGQNENLDREIRLALHNLSKSTDHETREFFKKVRKLSKSVRLKRPKESGIELNNYQEKNTVN